MGKKRMMGIGMTALSLIAVVTTGKILLKSHPPEYSLEWMRKLTLEDLKKHRVNVRLKYCNPSYSDSERNHFWNLLSLFDKVQSEKEGPFEKINYTRPPREHGYNLYKPD